jgi:hypothetical protein
LLVGHAEGRHPQPLEPTDDGSAGSQGQRQRERRADQTDQAGNDRPCERREADLVGQAEGRRSGIAFGVVHLREDGVSAAAPDFAVDGYLARLPQSPEGFLHRIQRLVCVTGEDPCVVLPVWGGQRREGFLLQLPPGADRPEDAGVLQRRDLGIGDARRHHSVLAREQFAGAADDEKPVRGLGKIGVGHVGQRREHDIGSVDDLRIAIDGRDGVGPATVEIGANLGQTIHIGDERIDKGQVAGG